MGSHLKIEWNEKSENGIRPKEVIQKVYRRVKYLNEELPCYENEQILYHLEHAIYWDQQRSQRRVKEKVKGTMVPHSY